MGYKFIFRLMEGVQVEIESNTFQEAQTEYEKVREETSNAKIKVVKTPAKKLVKKGLYNHIFELKEDGFFKEPKTLRDVKEKLSQLALHYPITSFPQYINRLIREKVLIRNRINRGGKEIWVYQDTENGN